MSKPLKGFITYSHKDLQQNAELKTRLAVMENEGKITLWDDNEILPGDEWYKDISTHLAGSDLLLYLVSAASLASKNCNKELAGALEINIRVIPIILESCDWENHQLSRFEVLPHKGKPISKWDHESDGWQDVVEGIRKTVEGVSVDAQKGTLPGWVFQQGNFLLMLGQIDKAIEAYSHAITLNPNNADAYGNRGVAYVSKDDYDLAIEDFNKAIQLDPNDAVAYCNHGVAYVNKGDYDLAIEDCNKAIQLNPNYAEAYYNRGAVYGNKGDYDLAIEDCNKAIDINPDYANAYSNRGAAYVNKCDFDRAIEDCNKAIDINPDYANAYSNRGAAYVNKCDFDRAIEDFNKAIDINPDYTDAYCNRGEAWLHLKEWEKARADLTAARDMGVDLIASFHNDYESVSDFERRNGVKLPADIAEMLTPPQ